MMQKVQKAQVKLHIIAGMAAPTPPIGPALGQHGVNIMEFCKQFNQQTINFEKGLPIPVIINIYSDKSFIFVVKNPVTTALLKKYANITKGSDKPGHNTIGVIKNEHIQCIVNLKKKDMTGKSYEYIKNSIIGTAKSMGLVIKD